MTHDAFLQSILEAPDDDAPRLVYADWLEDHGEALGPFIRTQCQLAAMADDDPRRLLLEADEARLRAEVTAALRGKTRPPWAARVPAWALRERWQFDRGMIGRLGTTAARYADEAAALHRAAPVQHLTLRNAPRFLDGLFICAGLRHIRSLDLSGNKLASGGAKALSESRHVGGLKELSLRSCRLRVAEVTRIVNAPALAGVERLRLGGNQLYDAGAEAVLASPHLRRLRELDLEGTLLGPRGAAALGRAERLERLRLANNRLGDEGARRLAAAEGLRRLTHLDLSNNNIDPRGVEALLRSAALPALARLNLTRNEVDAGVLSATPAAARHGRLRLTLSGPLTIGPAALASSPLVAACVGLDLSDCFLQRGNLMALVASAGVAGLRSLALVGVEPAVIEALGASPHLSNLEELRLDKFGWNDAHTRAVLAMPLLRRLKHLALESGVLAGAKPLLDRAADLAHLERLTVSAGFLRGVTRPCPLDEALGWRLRVE